MDTSLERKVVIGQRRFTGGHRTVGEEEEERNYHGGTMNHDGLHEEQRHGRGYGGE